MLSDHFFVHLSSFLFTSLSFMMANSVIFWFLLIFIDFYWFCRSTTIRLSDTINDANDWALEEGALLKAQTLLLKLESTEDLIHDTATVLLCLPIRTQSTYVQNVHRLERTLCRSESLHVSPSQISISRALIKRYTVFLYLLYNKWVCTFRIRKICFFK